MSAAMFALACLTPGCVAAAVRQSGVAAHAPLKPHLSLVLALGAVGAFYGRCDPGAHLWTLEFRNRTGVDDLVYARVGTQPMRRRDLPPGVRLVWHLIPGAARSREPGDSTSGRPATTIPTTRPLRLTVTQGSEPHIYRLDATLRLAAAIGDTTDCALVASGLEALTYFNGGAPHIP